MNKVKRTRVEKRNRTCTSQDGMALDEMNKAMPSEEFKEWNEKNLEGRIERI